MRKLNFGYTLLLLLALSCTAENINLSPIGTMSSTNEIYSYNDRKNLIVYSSEISNLISSFPKFRNDAVNEEVIKLKYYLKDYIGAMEAYNINGLHSAQRKFEKSYKKLQHLRKYLNKDDDQVLNRYLVRIKTNMTFMESNIPKDSIAIPSK
jgi:hypothetical protein